MYLNITLSFLYNIWVGAKFRGKTKKLFADIFASQFCEFCEFQFELTIISNLTQTVFFSVTREMDLE